MAENYLFVISGDNPVIGGYKLSNLSLAAALQQRGSNVGVLMAPLQMDVPDVDLASFHFYPVPLPSNRLLAFFRRGWEILRVISSGQYDVLVAADYYSMINSLPALIFSGPPLIQINANEKVPHIPPLYLPGIIVFSDWVYNGYQKIFGIPAEYLCLSSGRVNFRYFTNGFLAGEQKPVFTGKGRKILSVSRLVQEKIPSVTHLFDQLRLIGEREIVQLVIVGGGQSQASLEQSVAETLLHLHSESSITFAGAFRVTPDILRQAELVVGQGRTVIEAIASCVPAAVSGEDGYKGLITAENFLDFRKTDFSGRTMNCDNTLESDLQHLPLFLEDGFDKAYALAKEYYDVEIGIKAIETLCARILRLFPSPLSRRWAYLRAFLAHFIFRLGYYVKKVYRGILRKRAPSG